MRELITDEHVTHYPIRTLCGLTHALHFQEKVDFQKLQLVLQVARITKNACRMSLEPDLLITPLIKEGVLPNEFVFYTNFLAEKPGPNVLQVKRMLRLMQLVGVITPEIFTERKNGRLSNRDMVTLLQTGPCYVSQPPISRSLILYSRETKLAGVSLNVAMEQSTKGSEELDLRYVTMHTRVLAYEKDYSLST